MLFLQARLCLPWPQPSRASTCGVPLRRRRSLHPPRRGQRRRHPVAQAERLGRLPVADGERGSSGRLPGRRRARSRRAESRSAGRVARMTRRVLLDTNIVSHVLKGHPSVVQRLVATPMALLCISAVTAGELQFGLAKRPQARRLRAAMEAFLLRVRHLALVSRDGCPLWRVTRGVDESRQTSRAARYADRGASARSRRDSGHQRHRVRSGPRIAA